MVLDTVIMGNARLYEIMKEKEVLYAKEDFTDEDGIRASELEGEFATMNGWEAESDAATLLNGPVSYTHLQNLPHPFHIYTLLHQKCINLFLTFTILPAFNESSDIRLVVNIAKRLHIGNCLIRNICRIITIQ